MCTSGISDRTGVQLKDKWRNLVKFKHVSRVEADVAASKSVTINSRWAAEYLLVPFHWLAAMIDDLEWVGIFSASAACFQLHLLMVGRRASGGSDRRY